MPKKKKTSFFIVFLGVFAKSILALVFTAIPGTIQIYDFLGGSVNILDNYPPWVWFAPLFLYIAYVLGRTIYEYRKEISKYNSSSRPVRKKKVKSNKADNGGIALQDVIARDVSIGNTYTTQNIFPQNKPQIISFPALDGKIEIRHNFPETDKHGSEIGFNFTVLNETNVTLKCAVYVDKVAYKAENKWLDLDDLPSDKPLKWFDTLLPTLDGSYDIEQGGRLAFVLANVSTKHYGQDFILYNYRLAFFKNAMNLPRQNEKSHRILIRFHGRQFLGSAITKEFFIYLDEDKPGYKKYAGIEEFK